MQPVRIGIVRSDEELQQPRRLQLAARDDHAFGRSGGESPDQLAVVESQAGDPPVGAAEEDRSAVDGRRRIDAPTRDEKIVVGTMWRQDRPELTARYAEALDAIS